MSSNSLKFRQYYSQEKNKQSGYKKRNEHKIFHSSTKLIDSDSDIDEVFESMHQSIMTKIKNYCYKIGLS